MRRFLLCALLLGAALLAAAEVPDALLEEEDSDMFSDPIDMDNLARDGEVWDEDLETELTGDEGDDALVDEDVQKDADEDEDDADDEDDLDLGADDSGALSARDEEDMRSLQEDFESLVQEENSLEGTDAWRNRNWRQFRNNVKNKKKQWKNNWQNRKAQKWNGQWNRNKWSTRREDARWTVTDDDHKKKSQLEIRYLTFHLHKYIEHLRDFCQHKRRRRIAPIREFKLHRVDTQVVGEGALVRAELRIDGRNFVALAEQDALEHQRLLAAPQRGNGWFQSKRGRRYWHIKSLKPNWCSNAQLTTSYAQVDDINNSDLGWKAEHYDRFAGQTIDEVQSSMLGYIPPPADDDTPVIGPEPVEDADMDRNTGCGKIPHTYDFRDRWSQCRANTVLNQKTCGACYAFAAQTAYSLRLCRDTGAQVNVVTSPQEGMDCVRGCSGGNAGMVYRQSIRKGFPEHWCSPYLGKVEGGFTPGPDSNACNMGGCKKKGGLRYKAVDDTHKRIKGVENIQRAILNRGPVFASFTVYNDFMSYKRGIYTYNKKDPKVGGHAVVLVGWGVEKQVPYWIAQNSWGEDWGENGYFRIRRGTDECGIEVKSGCDEVTPDTKSFLPKKCPRKVCWNGGSLKSDCRCRCHTGWSRDSCTTCSRECHAGGKVNYDNCSCKCKAGASGENCEKADVLHNNIGCNAKHTPVFEYHGYDMPTGSYLAAYPTSVTKPFDDKTRKIARYAAKIDICGTAKEWTSSNTKCNDDKTGRIPLTKMASTLQAGEYNLWLWKCAGKNEFGQSKGFFIPTAPLASRLIKLQNCNQLKTVRQRERRREDQAWFNREVKIHDPRKVSANNNAEDAYMCRRAKKPATPRPDKQRVN